MKNLIIALLLLVSVGVNAQTFVACSDYDKTTGEPSGIYSSWDIKADGGYVYLLYSQSKNITKPLLLYVDKLDNTGEYIAYATENFNNSASSKKNWAMYDFKFTEPGKYKVSTIQDGKELASTIVTIQYADGEEEKANNNSSSSDENGYNDDYNDSEKVDTYYYEESTIIVATDVDDDFNPIGEADEFYAKRDGTVSLKIVISNSEKFATDKFYIDIYYTAPGTDKEELEKTLETDVNSDWVVSSTDYTFQKRGKYFIDVYNADDTYVNSATIEIK